MPNFPLDKERALSCLYELETEYLRVGTERCKSLEDRTQLSAFLLLGVRAVSLLRAMLRLLQPDTLDAYDAVRRTFIETWQLQFEFRLGDSASKVQKWFQGDAESWKSDKHKLERYMERRAPGPAGYGREFGELSEVTHPTYKASENSCAIATIRRAVNPNRELLEQSLEDLGGNFAALLNRQIWLTLDQDKALLEIYVSSTNLKCCVDFHDAYMDFLEKKTNQSHAS